MRAILGLVVALVALGLGWRWASRRNQLPCPSWLAWSLESRFTERLSGTHRTLDRIGLRPGERGLDVGCGPGRLTIPAALRVGPAGVIVALDVQPTMLERLQRRMAEAGLTNIVSRLGDITTDTGLPSEHFDRAWLVTVLGEIPDRAAALRNVHRILKPGGTLSITEIFPDPHYQRRDTVLRLCREAGFEPTQYYATTFSFTQNLIRSPIA